MIRLIENLSEDKFKQIIEIANKYNYRLDDVHNKPDDFILKSNELYGFAISYRKKPALLNPDIYIGGIVNDITLDETNDVINNLNNVIELAKEIKAIIDN